AALLVISMLAIFGTSDRSQAQILWEPAKKQDEDIQKTRALVGELKIDSAPFQKEMPLAKFLADLQAQLPKEKRLSLRIDKEAFGTDGDSVSETPVALAPSPQKWPLGLALASALRKSKIRLDYRVGSGEVVVTTPQRALYTTVYDVRDLIGGPAAPFQN